MRHPHIARTLAATTVAGALLALVAACGAAPAGVRPKPTPTLTASVPPVAQTIASPAFDKTAHSTTDPTSIWVIVNKTHAIDPIDFRPQISLVRGYQVAEAAAGPLTHLLDAADAAGVPLKIASAFRSLSYQQGVHSRLVSTLGEKAADRLSAPPGHSEHQTGLAVDLQPIDGTCALDACFAGTDAGRWIATHAEEFGFIVRYTKANRSSTHYSAEPWHVRYVGKPLARELRETGAESLETFFGE